MRCSKTSSKREVCNYKLIQQQQKRNISYKEPDITHQGTRKRTN